MKTIRGKQYYTAISDEELKTLIKEGIREVLNQELMQFRALLLPLVSKREQNDIERLYSKPTCKVAKMIRVDI